MKINVIYKGGELLLTSVPGFQHVKCSPPPPHGNELRMFHGLPLRGSNVLAQFQSSLNYLFYKVGEGERDLCDKAEKQMFRALSFIVFEG